MGKQKPATPIPRGNTDVTPESRPRLADAGGRLLAAEAEYLTAHGWAPSVVANPEGPGTVYWTLKGTTLRQAQAVHLQKLDDPLMKTP